MQREIRIETIGDLLGRFEIWAHCERCELAGRLDLPALERRYGPGLRLDTIKRCVTCRRCRRRTNKVSLVFSGESGDPWQRSKS